MNRYSSLYTSGGVSTFPDSGFRISYTTANDTPAAPVTVWASNDSTFVFTLFNSPSGSGKTTFIKNVYNYVQNIHSPLKFDFQPDHVQHNQCSYGYIPQNPPFALYWRISDFLPSTPKFLSCFFPNTAAEEILRKRFGQFSGGQRRKLYVCSALERLFLNGSMAAFLVFDEVFDGLGASEAKRCISAMHESWVTQSKNSLYIILVSHLEKINLIPDGLQTTRLGLRVENESTEQIDVCIYNSYE